MCTNPVLCASLILRVGTQSGDETKYLPLWTLMSASYSAFMLHLLSEQRLLLDMFLPQTFPPPTPQSQLTPSFLFSEIFRSTLFVFWAKRSPLTRTLIFTSPIVSPFSLILHSSLRSHSMISCRDAVVTLLEPRLDQSLKRLLILKVSLMLIALFIWSDRELKCVVWSLL